MTYAIDNTSIRITSAYTNLLHYLRAENSSVLHQIEPGNIQNISVVRVFAETKEG